MSVDLGETEVAPWDHEQPSRPAFRSAVEAPLQHAAQLPQSSQKLVNITELVELEEASSVFGRSP